VIEEDHNLPLTEIIKLIPGFDPYADCEGYYFDEDRARSAIRWIEGCCTLTKGKQFAGKPFLLRLWQKAVVANIFGWLSEDDGSRRFKEILIYVPRKNGKTELMAAMNNLVLFCDQEEGAEIYSAASTEDQAKIVFNVSEKMIRNNELLMDNCKIYQKSIVHDLTGSFYKPTVASASSTHGYNAHCVVVDELHACLESVVEVLETSQGARWQPLFFYTTTADFDRPSSICNKTHARACKVRDGILKDPNFLPVIYEATKEDDWHSEETWKKANPNYGVSLNIKEFKRAYHKACNEVSTENTFKKLRLNMKTEQSERWIDMLLWDLCGKNKVRAVDFRGHPVDIERFRGRPCIGGLDLSSTIDTSSLVLMFPEDGFQIISFFWIPEVNADTKEKTDKVPYRQWANEGWIKLTPGNRIDYAFIKQQIIDVCEIVDMKQLGFDPWNATQLSIDLTENHGIPMKMVRQGFVTMNEACKKMEADMAKGIIDHGGNPILRSHASNVMVKKDPSGSIKIDKEKSSEKVDGMVALADAYACHIADLDDSSVYNSHGILSLGGDDDNDYSNWEDDDDDDLDDEP
jgi:phage terminase large subunit-like protein